MTKQAEPNWELYKIATENWRFQIQQYWSRNSYFAAFETASLAGVIKVLEIRPALAIYLCGVGFALTLLWLLSNDRLQQYNRFWWEKMIELESRYIPNGEDAPRLAADFAGWRSHRKHRLPRIPWRYSTLTQFVVLTFVVAWTVLFVFALTS